MRIAVISDIHGNCLALDAALEDIHKRGTEQFVCLGDAIQGGVQPVETVQRLRELDCPTVMGNADAWLLTGVKTNPDEPMTERQQAVREWSLAQLSATDKAYIEQFRPTIEIALEADKKLLCFHGSPTSFDHIILPNTPEDEIQGYLGGYDAVLLTGGHTHTQQWRRIGEENWYFNPGSIGLSYDWRQSGHGHFYADPWACYAIVTSQGPQVSVEFCRVPLEVDKLLQVTRESGQPYLEAALGLYRGV